MGLEPLKSVGSRKQRLEKIICAGLKLDEFSHEQDQINNQIIGTTDPLPLEPEAKTVQWGPIPKERTAEEKKEQRKRKNILKERT